MRKLSLIVVISLSVAFFSLFPANSSAQSFTGYNIAGLAPQNAFESSSLAPAPPFAAVNYNFIAPVAPSLDFAPTAPPPPAPAVPLLSRFGMGVKVSTLGAGIEAAFKLVHRVNIRGGFNDFSYSRTINTNGFSADASLLLRSVEGHVDFFLLGPLHISAGALFYNNNHASGDLTVTGSNSFTLNSTTYYSDPSDPVNGTATLGLNKAAPTVTIGVGNLVGHHRFSVNFEVGAAFQGSPSVNMNLAGTACTSYPCVGGVNTINAATDSGLQTNLQAQEKKYSNDLTAFKYYPIISFGFGWRF